MLDTTLQLETPEGVELALRTAGPVPRALAFAIDIGIRMLIFLALSMTLGALGKSGGGILLLAVFILEWFYPVLFEIFWDGATPGKRSVGIKVMQDDGSPIRWSSSVLRNLMRTVDFLPLAYGIGIVSMLTSAEFKRMGDRAAGTIVVYRSEASTSDLKLEQAAEAPPWPLSPAEQKTIIDFAERLPRITPERADELALAAGPLVAGDAQPARRLSALASWIAGRR